MRLNYCIYFCLALGLILLGLHGAISVYSFEFSYDLEGVLKPTWYLIGLLVAAGIVYLICSELFRRLAGLDCPSAVDGGGTGRGCKSRWFLLMVLLGLGMRLLYINSEPIYEDDHYRYLWEGAVLAQGINPYEYSAEDVLEKRIQNAAEAKCLYLLADESGHIIERINHPQYRSVYPLVSQISFAISYWIKPWSTAAWRGVLLVFELWGLVVLLLMLRHLGRSPAWVLIYWWNPLVIKEIYNSAHVDVVMMPLMLLGVYWSWKRFHARASIAMSLAVGVKLWPLLLLPFIWRRACVAEGEIEHETTMKYSGLIRPMLYSVLIGLGMLVPILLAGLDESSGFVAYGKKWEMNDGLYMILLWLGSWLRDDFTGAHMVARLLSVFILGVVFVRLWRMKQQNETYLLRCALILVTVLFMISPTQFPWYYLWVMPWLVFFPLRSLLLLSVSLSLYYARFYYDARDEVAFFDNTLVWLQYVPVWMLMVAEWHLHRCELDEVETSSTVHRKPS